MVSGIRRASKFDLSRHYRGVRPIPKVMRAAVYRGINQVQIESVPVPRTGANELLVRVAVCGVCPTDLKKIHYGTVPPPRIFGHETAGTIVRVGARVRGFREGDRVGLHHHVPCLECHACRHHVFAQCPQYKRTGITAGFEPAGGGFAEYVRVLPFVFPGVVNIPARNTFLEGALLEPVNTVLKAVRRLSLLRGDRVLVIGQGPIGLMFTRLLSLAGQTVIASDLMETRLARARLLGAAAVVRADRPKAEETIQKCGGRNGIDAVVVTVSLDTAVVQAQRIVNAGGKVLLFAHTHRGELARLDLSQICLDERDLIGSYSADFLLQRDVARLVFSRRIPVAQLVSHRFSLTQINEAIDLASRPTAQSLKVVIAAEENAAG